MPLTRTDARLGTNVSSNTSTPLVGALVELIDASKGEIYRTQPQKGLTLMQLGRMLQYLNRYPDRVLAQL